jgi:HEPN domain-containing protein
MTNISLAKDYMVKAVHRLDVLDLLFRKRDYSDVVRESQEVVELALKAMLRQVCIDPPKWHDVGMILREHEEKFPQGMRDSIEELSEISKWLRRERELAFYGDIDFIPSEEYKEEDATRAISGAKKVVEVALLVVNI